MTKKIKDLTVEDLSGICRNTTCAKCPFSPYGACPLDLYDTSNKVKDFVKIIKYIEEGLEKEVEIDDK